VKAATARRLSERDATAEANNKRARALFRKRKPLDATVCKAPSGRPRPTNKYQKALLRDLGLASGAPRNRHEVRRQAALLRAALRQGLVQLP
jgi:hypothetical protein